MLALGILGFACLQYPGLLAIVALAFALFVVAFIFASGRQNGHYRRQRLDLPESRSRFPYRPTA